MLQIPTWGPELSIAAESERGLSFTSKMLFEDRIVGFRGRSPNVAKRLRKPSKRTCARSAPDPTMRSEEDPPSPGLHIIPIQHSVPASISHVRIPSNLTLCRVESRWRRRLSNAKATSSFESVDASCSLASA